MLQVHCPGCQNAAPAPADSSSVMSPVMVWVCRGGPEDPEHVGRGQACLAATHPTGAASSGSGMWRQGLPAALPPSATSPPPTRRAHLAGAGLAVGEDGAVEALQHLLHDG